MAKFQKKFPRLSNFLKSLIKNVDTLIGRLDKEHIFLLAAGIAFNILLYLIPLFLVSIAVVNLVFEVDFVTSNLERLMKDQFPPTQQADQLISTILVEVRKVYAHSDVFGYIAVAILLWISSLVFSSFRSGLNAIFEIRITKFHLVYIYRLKDMLLSIILAVLILLWSFALPLSSYIREVLVEFFPEIVKPYVTGAALTAFSLISSFTFIYLLYRYVPNKRIPALSRLISTFLSMILLEIARNIFAWYLTTLSNYGRFYGTYGVIVSMAIWIYLFVLIILISAAIGRLIFENKYQKHVHLEEDDEYAESEENDKNEGDKDEENSD